MSPCGKRRRVETVVSGGLALIVTTGLSAGGCREQGRPQPSTRPAAATSQPRTAIPAESEAPARPGDLKEEDKAPAYLPANLPREGWVRQEGLRMADAAGLEKLLPTSQAVWFEHFRIKSAASCAYIWEGGGRDVLARVVVFEALSPDDAYGLMSCQSSSPELLGVGGETRVESGVESHLHCWQGNAYVHVWTDSTDEKAVLQTRRLLMHIAGRLPRTDPPALIEAMPRDSAKPGKRWLVRNLSCLRPTVFSHPAGLDLGEVSKLLDLGMDTVMCIAAYDVPEGRRANVVWVVHYATESTAAEAYTKYARRLEESPPGSPWQSTLLLPPHGAFLVGTWTAEEESIQYMLPRIIELLPALRQDEPPS